MSTLCTARSGFVRIPRKWVALEVSPGARVLLFHFCGAANAAGESWYKFAQLTEIVGRSKAAISGYLKELRAAGVVETEQQRTANGYHAHLLVRLVGWSSFLAEWSAMTEAARRRSSGGEPSITIAIQAQHRAPEMGRRSGEGLPETSACSSKTEHSIHNTERNYPTDNNKINNINTRSISKKEDRQETKLYCESWSIEDEKRWRYYKSGAPGLSFEREPPIDILKKAIRCANIMERAVGWYDEAEARACAASKLRAFAKNARVAVGDGLDNAAAMIAKRARTPSSIARAIDIIRESWAPHWRRLSTPEQIAALLDSEGAKERLLTEQERMVHRIRARASIARIELKRRREEEAQGYAIAATSLAARMVAHDTPRTDTAREATANGSALGQKIRQIQYCPEFEVSR